MEACLQLGIEPCELKYISKQHFLKNLGDNDLAELAFKHHETVRQVSSLKPSSYSPFVPSQFHKTAQMMCEPLRAVEQHENANTDNESRQGTYSLKAIKEPETRVISLDDQHYYRQWC